MARASESEVKRDDDNAETLKTRLRNFHEVSEPVVSLYKKFGKVRVINANVSIAEVYEESRKAILPQVAFMGGPTKAGKTTLSQALAERTNMAVLNYPAFIQKKNLFGKGDEVQVTELIKHLVDQASPRVLIEDFPETEGQAKYFMKNCVVPTHAFYVRCSLDDSQERMLSVGKGTPTYLPSAILSKKVRNFNEQAQKILPLLRSSTNFVELDTGSQTFEKSFKDLCNAVEPCVLHVRSFTDQGGVGSDEVKDHILQTLTDNWQYAEINVNEVISLESERKTVFGKEFLSMVSTGKMIPAESIVRMLRRVIFSGDGRTKYILSGGFPFTVDHAKEFEKSCSSIAAVIYSPAPYEEGAIHFNSLSVYNIDTLFQKDFRLRVLSDWDEQHWQEIFDSVKVDWCLVLGQPLSGKTTVANTIKKAFGPSQVTVVDWQKTEEQIKSTLGSAEEPFQGDVPLAQLEDAVVSMIQQDKKAGKRLTYVFDAFPKHPSSTEFAKFQREKLRCPPDHIITAVVQDTPVLVQRFKAKVGAEADLSEEQQEEFRQSM